MTAHAPPQPHMARTTETKRSLGFTLAPAPLLLRKCTCANGAENGECEECRKKKKLQRSATRPGQVGSVPSIVHDVLSQPGRPLDAAARGYMEPRFGHDFSQVRIHDDSHAATSAKAVDANAYTVGQHIVFGSGQYRPHTEPGQRLLAHELAHTIQQSGLQRASRDIAPASSADPLEAEAERAASAVVDGRSSDLSLSSSSPRLSRQATGTPSGGGGEGPALLRSWQTLLTPISTNGVQITAWQDQGTGIVAFRVSKFILPATKGRVLEFYRAKVAEQALEATVGFTGRSPNAALWQSRDSTQDLRATWLGKLGWTSANALENWHQAGGRQAPAGTTEFRPVLRNNVVCQMDHIVELQLGGTNTRNNIQVLDPDDNQQSGRDIWSWIRSLAQTARESRPPNARPDYVLLHFDDVEQPAVPAFTGCPAPGQAARGIDVEACAMTRRVEAPATGAAALVDFPVEAAGARDTLRVQPAPEPETDLSGDENRAARQLVAGMLLTRHLRATGGNRDTIRAEFDSNNLIRNRSATRIPIQTTERPSAIIFAVDPETRKLRMTEPRRPHVEFLYPFLSRAELNLTHDPDQGLGATGTLTPTLPLLSRAQLQLDLNSERLRAELRADPARVRSPIPGLTFTELSLGADLLPEFRVAGRIGFKIGPRGREMVTGLLEASVAGGGLVLTGDVFANIPGTDRSQGHAEYRNGQWSGYVVVESSRIRLPGVQRGEVRVDFNPDGSIRPSGTVDLLVAGNPVTLSVAYQRNRIVLEGRASVRVPGLRPVQVNLLHDGEHLSGSATTGVDIGGLSGTAQVRYRDGRLSGQGTVSLQRGRASGSITLRISEAGRLSGEGTATVRLTNNLIGTVGIIKPEVGPIRVNGELRFPNPIQLFRGIERNHTLFERTLEFPIPGLSIPVVNVGAIATLTGRLTVGYGFGPGVLSNIRVGVGFNPLEEEADLAVDAGAQLSIPAHAELSIAIRAGAGLSAGVARVTGGITGTGTVGLRGGFTGAVEFTYRNANYAVQATAAIRVRPVFRLGLDADITAEVGAFGYTAARWQKVWNLYGFEWGADAEAGLIARLRYSTSEGFILPSASNIEWIVPRIEVGDVLSSLFRRARTSERDRS